jgi:hypothetical protein
MEHRAPATPLGVVYNSFRLGNIMHAPSSERSSMMRRWGTPMLQSFDWVRHLTLLSPFVPVFTALIGLFRKAEPSLTRLKGEARLWSWSIGFDYRHDSRGR